MEERFLSFVCFLSVATDLVGVEGVGPGGDVAQHHSGHEVLDGLYLLLAHLNLTTRQSPPAPLPAEWR